MPLARKFLLSTCPERHLLPLRSTSTLNLSVLQALMSPSFYSLLSLLSSLSPCSFPAYSPLPSVIRPSAPYSTPAITFRLPSLEDKVVCLLCLQIGDVFVSLPSTMEISHFTCPYASVVLRALLVLPLITCLRAGASIPIPWWRRCATSEIGGERFFGSLGGKN